MPGAELQRQPPGVVSRMQQNRAMSQSLGGARIFSVLVLYLARQVFCALSHIGSDA
jgi:hypothetical protein